MGADGSIRLAVLIQGLEVGGMEVVAIDLVNHLPDRYHVTFCCFDHIGSLAKRLKPGVEVELIERRPGFDMGFVRRLRGFLKDRRIDVLHMHNHTAFAYGTLASRLASIRTIYTEHGRTETMSKKAQLLYRLLSRRVSQTVVVSKSLIAVLADEGFRRDSIRYVPNGIEDHHLDAKPLPDKDAALAAELGLEPDDHVIGIVARLHPVKNHPMLLRAMKIIAADDPRARLVIVGDGPDRLRVENLAHEFGLDEVVRFVGERDDVPALMAFFDIYALSSFSEGMSLTLLEAMAAGLPSVVTGVGGNPLLIEDGQQGLVVPSDDHEAFAAAALRILGDTELSQRLARNSRQRFVENYTIDRMVDRYVELFEGS